MRYRGILKTQTGCPKAIAACLAVLGVLGFSDAFAGETTPSGNHADGLPADMAIVLESVKPAYTDPDTEAAVKAMTNPKAKVVVVGDSHAPRLQYPLAQWGVKNNYAIDLLKLGGGCPGLLDTYVFTRKDKGETTECNALSSQKIRDLADQDYGTVIFAARWGLYTSYMTSLSSGDPAKKPLRNRSLSQNPDQGFVNDLTSSQDAFVTGVRTTVAYFKSKGMRVIFVTQAPPLGPGFVRCITSQPTPVAVSENCFPVTYEDQLKEIQWSTEKLVALGNELGFDVVNAHDVFCASAICTAMNKQGVFYTDDNHLSYAGAAFLAPKVEKIIEKLK